jgi:hypothetical protein
MLLNTEQLIFIFKLPCCLKMASNSRAAFPNGSGLLSQSTQGSSSWLLVEDEKTATASQKDKRTDGQRWIGHSTGPMFESIGLNSSISSIGSRPASLARSHGEIDRMSFCRLGASLLKKGTNLNAPVSKTTNVEPPRPFFDAELTAPPFQKSEAYMHYQRSLSSSESDSDTTDEKQENPKSNCVIDTDDQLMQVCLNNLLRHYWT